MAWKVDVGVAAAALLLGQIGVFYLYAYQCALTSRSTSRDAHDLRALVVSDVHLLGKRRRTSVERLWIDWQIAMSLRAAVHAHRPDVVLVLGDQLDEGGFPTPQADYEQYAQRFMAAFRSVGSLKTLYLMGNHDSAFGAHLTMPAIKRHEHAFGPANHVTLINGHQFVQLDTMALDADVSITDVRAEAASLLQTIAKQDKKEHTGGSVILLTHLPLYRDDDLQCGAARLRESGHVTYEHPSFKYEKHHHVLSPELSERLLDAIQPTLALSGHTHAQCTFHHQQGTVEHTIPAFSWGQRPDPSYAVLHLRGNHARLASCPLPRESYVFLLYAVTLVILALRFAWRCVSARGRQRSEQDKKYT